MSHILDLAARWRLLLVLTLAALAWAVIIAPWAALGAETPSETVVVVNWGDFVSVLLAELAKPDSVAWTIFGLVAAWVVSRLPAPLQWTWRLFQIEQLLEKSLRAGMNTTIGAFEGHVLSMDVGNKVVANALQYAIDNGSAAAIKWAGGEEALRQKLLARITIEPQAALRL